MLPALGKAWLTMWSCNILCHTFKSGLPLIYSYLYGMRTFSSPHPDILCIHCPQQTECYFIHTSESIRLMSFAILHAQQTGMTIVLKKKCKIERHSSRAYINFVNQQWGEKQSSWNFIKHRQSHIYQTRWRYKGRLVPVHALQAHGGVELIHNNNIRR